MSPSMLRLLGDERLARLVASGHDAAFAALYDRYRDVLVRYCRSLVRDEQDALDAFQTAMLKALRALREDRRNAPLRPWLFRIAHNESVSVLRRRPVASPLEDADRAPAADDVHRTAEDREALAALLADLEALTDRQRSALLLRELAGLGYDELAAALDTSPLAARQAVFAARASLHDQRDGREMRCELVRRRLSDGERGAARTRAIRAHLRSCDDCRSFAAAIARRRRVAALLPVPPAATSGLLAAIFDAAGSPAGAGTSTVAAGLAAKAAVAVTAAVVATGATKADRPERHATATAAAPAAAKHTAPHRSTAGTTTTTAASTRVAPATATAAATRPATLHTVAAVATERTSARVVPAAAKRHKTNDNAGTHPAHRWTAVDDAAPSHHDRAACARSASCQDAGRAHDHAWSGDAGSAPDRSCPPDDDGAADTQQQQQPPPPTDTSTDLQRTAEPQAPESRPAPAAEPATTSESAPPAPDSPA